MRKIKFKVAYQQDVGFCGEARIEFLQSFDTHEEAEKFILEYPQNSIDDVLIQKVFWIQKVYENDMN